MDLEVDLVLVEERLVLREPQPAQPGRKLAHPGVHHASLAASAIRLKGSYRQAFATHQTQTEQQVQRLKEVFDILGQKAEGVPCEAIWGILEEGREVLQEFAGGPALDAGLIAAAQAVEHYEIARYGALRSWAELIGLDEVEELLDQTLTEEKATDALLTQLAEGMVNVESA